MTRENLPELEFPRSTFSISRDFPADSHKEVTPFFGTTFHLVASKLEVLILLSKVADEPLKP
jgi:hypothetical protein